MKIYFVKPGDTLSAIAEKHGVTVQQMLDANPIMADPDDLKVAMKLVIPVKEAGQPVPGSMGGSGKELPAKAMPADQPQVTKDIPDKAKPADQPQVTKDIPDKAKPAVEMPPKEPVSIPALPKFPEFTGMVAPEPAMPIPAMPIKQQEPSCHSCKSGGPAPMPKPLPYALPTKEQMIHGTGGHPTAAMPPCPPVAGACPPVAGAGPAFTPLQPAMTGGPAGAPFAQPAFPQGMPFDPWPGHGAVQHPFAAMPQPAYPVQGSTPVGSPPDHFQGQPVFGGPWSGGQPGSGPWSGGQPGSGPWSGSQPGSGPWSASQPGSGTGFHSPYNTPFSVNPYMMPANQSSLPGFGTLNQPFVPQSPEQPSPWQPYRLQTAAATPFVSPHAAPPAGESADDTGDEEETIPVRTGSGSNRKKTAGKKRKPAGDTLLKDKILRLQQRNHRRY